ncbi:MAG: hypothetical protein AAB250_15150, partial [Bdellovibrionota bacterium]
MKTLRRSLSRLLKLALVVSLTVTTPSANAVPLKERLNAIDDLANSFHRLRDEEESLARAIAAFQSCLLPRPRALEEIETCLEKSLQIQSSAAGSRRLIARIVESTGQPELQPLPDSFASKLEPLMRNFSILGLLVDRLVNENHHFTTFEMSKYAPPTCDDIVRRARSARSGQIVIDMQVSICKAVRLPLIRDVHPTSFMTETVSVSFDENEGVHIGPGDSDAKGSEDGGCLGRGCGEDGSSYGENRGRESEAKSGFDPDRYDRERVRVREWVESGAEEYRPVPLSDDQIMKLERDRFETEIGEKTWPVIESSSGATTLANETLDNIPPGKLYDVDPASVPSSTTARTVVSISPDSPADSKSLAIRLGYARHRLESSRPSTRQSRTAREIGLVAIDDGPKSLPAGAIEDA